MMKSILHEKLMSNKPMSLNFSYQNTPSSFPEHWHTQTEFILALEDHSIFTVNGERYELQKNEVLFIWSTELHSILSAPKASCIVLQFDSDFITSCKDFNVFYHSMRTIHHLKNVSEELNSYFADSLKKMDTLLNDTYSEARMTMELYQMLIHLCLYLRDHRLPRPELIQASSPAFRAIKKACDYIDQNCSRALSQTEVARYCGFSTCHFSKLFHKYTCDSFPEYLVKRRITLATRLLHDENIKISDVAYLSGFQSLSNFNRQFKLSLGYTPLQYRTMYLESNTTLTC